MQGLMGIADQMHKPRQGIRLLRKGRVAATENRVQYFQLPIKLATGGFLEHQISPYFIKRTIDEMPVAMSFHVGKPLDPFRSLISVSIIKTRVFADVVGPRGGFDENGSVSLTQRPLVLPCPLQPASVIRVGAKDSRDFGTVCFVELIPSDGRHKAMAGSIPRASRKRQQKKKPNQPPRRAPTSGGLKQSGCDGQTRGSGGKPIMPAL